MARSGRPVTFVLIHGGGSTGRYWDRLVPLLDGPAFAVDLPGRAGKPADLGTLSVEQEVESVLADLREAVPDGPVVLVVHSSGGLVVPGVVAGLAGRVEHIVLSAASVPPEGGCGLDCMQPRHAEGLAAVFEAADRDGTVLTTPGPPADREAFRTAYGGDPLDDVDLAFMVDPARTVPDTMHHYRQPVHWSLVGDVPVTYVLNERDRPVPAALQDEMIARLPNPPKVIRLDGGHIPAVTEPQVFADIVNAVVVG